MSVENIDISRPGNVMPRYIHAKRIMDYFLEKAQDDITVKSQFAQQLSLLKIMEYKCENVLTSLCSYRIEIEK